MALCKWEELPENMKTQEVRPYYDALSARRAGLIGKRIFDIIVSAIMLIVLSPLFLIIAVSIKLDSKGPVFYRQKRVTQYGCEFGIHKFRTMVPNADKIGTLVTVGNDPRITKVGSFLRKCRLDEIPQLLDIFSGNMSFVGTRPEVPRYVAQYSAEMMATLLLPAGVTSEASIRYIDEAEILENADDVDKAYVEQILPEKMKYNLESIMKFSLLGEIKTMFRTVIAVLK